MNLALFDLDNTLLNGDSDFEWAQFLIDQGVLDRELFEAKNLAFYEQYKAGTLDINEFLDFQLKPLSRHARRVLDRPVEAAADMLSVEPRAWQQRLQQQQDKLYTSTPTSHWQTRESLNLVMYAD